MNGKRLLECLAAAALAGLLLTLPFLVEKRPTAGGRGLTGGWLVLAVTGMALMLYCVGFLPEPFRKNSRAALAAAAAHLSRRPVATLALVAALAVCASTYPVVFLGSSFVSPGYGGVNLLYDGFPTLPGATDVSLQRGAGADTSVILWQDIPYAKIASVSLRTGVLPLWNRFNSAGVPLLGQGQSMVGSPLHLPVIVAGGGAMVWDAVFLGRQILLALGFGLVVWNSHATFPPPRSRPSPLPFIGFFRLRVITRQSSASARRPGCSMDGRASPGPRSLRSILAWTGLLLLASWAELTSGTVKETLALLLCTNLAGVLLLACSPAPANLPPPGIWRRTGGRRSVCPAGRFRFG